jgi:hypothetical protein
MITLHQPLDYAKCFATIRALRRPDKTSCCQCRSQAIITQGKDDAQPERQPYNNKAGQRRFDDLTGTMFRGRFLNEADIQPMTRGLYSGIVSKKTAMVVPAFFFASLVMFVVNKGLFVGLFVVFIHSFPVSIALTRFRVRSRLRHVYHQSRPQETRNPADRQYP